ncbi:VOC family protein [Rossellomorea vietnamensis]|uniref:VOC family protein n=1 Tax=Rossellomorea vietnamensis TaxID=218284 RepID=UPI003CF9062E
MQLGIKVIEGGKHEKWDTFNTLAYFGLSYFEWLGIQYLFFPYRLTITPNQQLVTVLPLGDQLRRIAPRTNNMD